MNTVQLRECLKILNIKNCNVYALDQLPKFTNQLPEGGIVNSDVAAEPGSHWYAFYRDKVDSCEFFDSFGRAPPPPILKNLCSSGITSYYVNPEVLQGEDSITCGLHCLYYLHHRTHDG